MPGYQDVFSRVSSGIGGSLMSAGIGKMVNPPVQPDPKLVRAQRQQAQAATVESQTKADLYRERIKAALALSREQIAFMREAFGFQAPPEAGAGAAEAQQGQPQAAPQPTRPGPRGPETQGTPNKPMPFPAPLGDPNNPGSPRGPVSQGNPAQDRARQYLNAFSTMNVRQRMQQRGLV